MSQSIQKPRSNNAYRYTNAEKEKLSWLNTSLMGVLILSCISVLFFALFSIEGAPFQWIVKAREWTGFGEGHNITTLNVTEETKEGTKTIIRTTKTTTEEFQPTKRLWDWMPLLFAPATLALLGFMFQSFQEKAKQNQEEADEKRVADQQREHALQAYFDQLSALLVDKRLNQLLHVKEANTNQVNSVGGSANSDIDAVAALNVIKARTLALLRMFDEDILRKASVISFLADSNLLKQLNLDLSGSRLRGANLKKVNISDCDLSDADLKKANLSGANLRGTKLINANLSGANLSRAYLSGADLTDANLKNANLTGAIFNGADLIGLLRSSVKASVDPNHAGLSDVVFTGLKNLITLFVASNINGGNLDDTNLLPASLNGANFSGAKLAGAFLGGSDFSRVTFWDTQLTGIELGKAKNDAVERIQAASDWKSARYATELCQLLGLPPETLPEKSNVKEGES